MSEMLRKLVFRLRWLTMSDRQRYAYLWVRSEGHLE